MTDRNAQYQATYRKRALNDTAAALLGWTKIPILSAYLNDKGELIVVDKSGASYGTDATALPTVKAKPLVEPDDIPATDFGPRWESGHEKMAKGLTALSLSSTSHDVALKGMEQIAASLLRGVELLREHNGPDWREQIGLDS